jgi:hypothetical protein
MKDRFKRSLAWGALISMALAVPAQAQPRFGNERDISNDHRAQLGIVIPFGGKREEAKPRLELSLTNDRFLNNGAGFRWGEPLERRKMNIGFTLDERPVLMLNGKAPPKADTRKGISTWGWVAIGTGAALVVGGALFWDALEDASE